MTFFTKICIVFLCNFLIINSGLYTLSLNSYHRELEKSYKITLRDFFNAETHYLLSSTFESNKFNCLSSALIFLYLFV